MGILIEGGTVMRVLVSLILFALVSAIGCASPESDGPADRIRLQSVDGLDRVEIDLPGILEIRKDHRIGRYDALLIPVPSMSYENDSLRLTPDGQHAFLTLLRDSIVEASQRAALPVVEQPGPCVMEISLQVSRMDLETALYGDQLAELILIMQFRDSVSGEPLLRYAKQDRVPHPEKGITPDQQIRRGLDRIVAEMDLSTALRPAGLAQDVTDPVCKGTLAARGRAASERR
jgi:hypothetical protein